MVSLNSLSQDLINNTSDASPELGSARSCHHCTANVKKQNRQASHKNVLVSASVAGPNKSSCIDDRIHVEPFAGHRHKSPVVYCLGSSSMFLVNERASKLWVWHMVLLCAEPARQAPGSEQLTDIICLWLWLTISSCSLGGGASEGTMKRQMEATKNSKSLTVAGVDASPVATCIGCASLQRC